MPVTWKTTDSFERLLAAWWASSETHKPNYRLIAKYYGKGTTYDSIEGRFRHIKRQAEGLKAESSTEGSSIDLDSPGQSFASTTATFAGSSSQNGTPKKKARAPRTPKKDGTSGGRVSKNSTPTKVGRGGRKRGVDGRDGVAGQQQQLLQQGVKMEVGSNGESEASGGMLDELNGIVGGEVDWLGGGGVSGEGRGRGRNGNGNGNGNGCGHGALVGGEYGNENDGYWDVGDADEDEEDLGEMV